MANADRFEEPITVREPSSGNHRFLRTAREASEFLLTNWPAKKTEKYRTALQACHDAAAGDKPPMTARRAFLAAGREAGVLVKSD